MAAKPKKTLADLLGDDFDPEKMVLMPRWLVRLLVGGVLAAGSCLATGAYWVTNRVVENTEALIRLQVVVERIEEEVCRPSSKVRGAKYEPLIARPRKVQP